TVLLLLEFWTSSARPLPSISERRPLPAPFEITLRPGLEEKFEMPTASAPFELVISKYAARPVPVATMPWIALPEPVDEPSTPLPEPLVEPAIALALELRLLIPTVTAGAVPRWSTSSERP